MTLTRTKILTLALSGVLVAGLVGAQTSITPAQSTPEQTQSMGTGKGGRSGRHGGQGMGGFGMQGQGFGDRGGMGGFGLRGLALNTKATFSFYEADPATGATATETLEFTYGVDSEAAFAEQFQTAREAATFMKVDISEQTRTVDLSTFEATQRQGLMPRELARPGALNEGSSITATFYDADPASGGTVLETLTFTQGVSSAAGFANDFSTAAQSAAFVTISTSPQSRTIDLTAMPQRGQGFDQEDFGQQGFGSGGHHHGFGQGFGPGMNPGSGPGNGMNNTPGGPVAPENENNTTPDGTSDNS
jgi:hypothetical protein